MVRPKGLYEKESKVETFRGRHSEVSLFPDDDEKERRQFQAGRLRSQVELVADRFNGVCKIVGAIGGGQTAHDLN